MRRDMELIRRILEWMAGHGPQWVMRGAVLSAVEGEADFVSYHIDLCLQAGFIVSGNPQETLQLTWAGHEILDELQSRVRCGKKP